ncbi:MAG: hypothetical protein LBT20_05500, partial [Clostridiales bacterium]|nr:hypothetical protein [Clostridiales bacterium]
MDNVHLVTCYTNEEKENKCVGVFYEKEDGLYHLRIESNDVEVYRNYKNLKIINCDYNNQSYFLFEIAMTNWGCVVGTATYFVEYDVYKHGIGINCFDIDSLKIQQVTCNYNYL